MKGPTFIYLFLISVTNSKMKELWLWVFKGMLYLSAFRKQESD